MTAPTTQARTKNSAPRMLLNGARRSGDGLEEPFIFNEVCEKLGFNPSNYSFKAGPPRKRDKHNAGKLTGRVWDSLLPDGSVDPEKAVPYAAVTTQELPQVRR